MNKIKKIKIKKKGHPTFNVPNFGAKGMNRVLERWRKQRGIDSKKRIKKKSHGAEPTIGYGNSKEVRGLRASGKMAILIHNQNEMTLALEKDKEKFEIMFSKQIGSKKREELAKSAKAKGFNITNM